MKLHQLSAGMPTRLRALHLSILHPCHSPVLQLPRSVALITHAHLKLIIRTLITLTAIQDITDSHIITFTHIHCWVLFWCCGLFQYFSVPYFVMSCYIYLFIFFPWTISVFDDQITLYQLLLFAPVQPLPVWPLL